MTTTTKQTTKTESKPTVAEKAAKEMLKEAIPTEWVKLAKDEAKSFERADLTSLKFFLETREVLRSEAIIKGMVKRMDLWVDMNIDQKGTANRLKRIIKLAEDSITYHVGDAEKSKGEKLHISLNMDIIHFYNLEDVIRLKKLMTKEMEKKPEERKTSGNSIKKAQKAINDTAKITDKKEYNNALTDAIEEAKKLLGVDVNDDFVIKSKVESFEKFLKSLPVDEAGRVIAKIQEDFAAWKKALQETPAEKMAEGEKETEKAA